MTTVIEKQLKDATNITEALAIAGVTTEVEAVPVFQFDEGRGFESVPFGKVIRNTITKKPYSIGGRRYTTIQNDEHLGIFDPLVQSGRWVYDNIIEMKDGLFCAATIRTKDSFTVGNDEMVSSLMLLASHGRRANRLFINIGRLVCQNQLSGILSDPKQKALPHVRHLAGYREKQAVLANAVTRFDFEVRDIKLAGDAMTTRYISDPERVAFIEQLGISRDSKQGQRTIDNILDLAASGKGNAPYRGTVWALLNGVTEYFDHHAKVRADSNRAEYVLLGRAGDIKRKAWNRAVELVK